MVVKPKEWAMTRLNRMSILNCSPDRKITKPKDSIIYEYRRSQRNWLCHFLQTIVSWSSKNMTTSLYSAFLDFTWSCKFQFLYSCMHDASHQMVEKLCMFQQYIYILSPKKLTLWLWLAAHKSCLTGTFGR